MNVNRGHEIINITENLGCSFQRSRIDKTYILSCVSISLVSIWILDKPLLLVCDILPQLEV